MGTDEKHIKRLIAARYLYQLAKEQAAIDREAAVFASISLLQDALEAFLVTAADYLNAKVKPKSEFTTYLDLINEKLPDGEDLPLRTRVQQINKVRVFAKHDGVRPDRTEVFGYLTTAQEFLAAGAKKVFGEEFWSISLVSLLDDGEPKTFLEQCETALQQKDYVEALISCRKAFFLEFEKQYDVKQFKDGTEAPNFLARLGCNAPLYACSSEYIEKNVCCPFDYIVRDHAHIDTQLLKLGIDHGTWWNIWRLTPEVYRSEKTDTWAVKHVPELFEESESENRAIYAFESTVDVILRKQAFNRSLRWARSSTSYVVKPKHKARIYRKADKRSEILFEWPDHLKEIPTSYATPGICGEGSFWYVSDYFPKDEGGDFISGFIDEEEIDWD